MRTEYDCQGCGACCVDYFGGDGYIDLAPGEDRRMRRLGLAVVSFHGAPLLETRPHAGPGGDTACAAFVGTVGVACHCSIYPDRPQSCRRFQVGSPGCRFAREAAGLPV